MVEFGLFLLPRSCPVTKNNQVKKNRIPNRPKKAPIPSNYSGIGIVFLGLGPNIVRLATTTPNCPERMKTSHGQEAAIIYVMYVRAAAAAEEGGRLSCQMVCATPSYNSAKALPVWRGHANPRPRRRPAKSYGRGLEGCRCNIDYTAACFVAHCCSILTQVLCVLFFCVLLHSSGQRTKWSCSGLCGDTRTSHSTPHARTVQRALVASMDSPRMIAAGYRAPTRSSSRSSNSYLI